ncbi:hypothetical protein BS50DRAFT_609363 [Corynespora cassiicola Philippines]|uniref:Uncharacterized protein n=1 Tax=Corynespora cassiicola Philippines TaxID=1448308 RepID=A0A2T2NVA1_CORCC|nr:hypothetical protein BS50DRAFT_609363 [Corynespora cassiicola Philippines]
MARPKRTKITSAATRVAKTSRAADPGPREQPGKAANPKAAHPTDSFSDDSDGLVVKSTQPRIRQPWQPEPQPDMDVSMTGALPVDEEKSDAPRRTRRQQTASTPASKTQIQSHATRGSARASSKKPSPTVPGPTESSVHEAMEQEDDSTGFGDNLLTFTSLDSNSPAHGTRPPSAIKVGATPAHESSILALTKFKRRPRQPSLLRMVHQTTDVEDNDLDVDIHDFDDFHPDDESTPLHNQKRSRLEDMEGDSGLGQLSSGSRGRKLQVPRSSPPYDPPSGADVARSRREGIAETQEPVDPDVMKEKIEELPRRRADSEKVNHDPESEEEGHAPNRTRRRQKKPQGISTVKLQALLPPRDEYDVQSSDDLPARRQRSAPSKGKPKKKQTQVRGAKKTPTQVKPATRRNTRTYENDGNDTVVVADDGSESTEEPTESSITMPPDQLAAIAKKFQEVDAWEMDFESVEVTTDSSPWR